MATPPTLPIPLADTLDVPTRPVCELPGCGEPTGPRGSRYCCSAHYQQHRRLTAKQRLEGTGDFEPVAAALAADDHREALRALLATLPSTPHDKAQLALDIVREHAAAETTR